MTNLSNHGFCSIKYLQLHDHSQAFVQTPPPPPQTEKRRYKAVTYGHVVLRIPRQQSRQRTRVQQQPVVFTRHKLQWKMAFKTWPYGGKPSIAVAKETKSGLLTVWPIKLWGAVTPVTPTQTKRESGGKSEFGQETAANHLGVCARRLPWGGGEGLVIPHRRGCNFSMLSVCRQQRWGKKVIFINELFVLAAEPEYSREV